MLAKRIIPCMDIKNQRVVKGVNFINLVDAGDPVELGKTYSQNGADELVYLDITATITNQNSQSSLIKRIARNLDIPFTVGGGVRSIKDVDNLLNQGADKISLNSAAVHQPNLITELAHKFGSQCVVVAIDIKKIKNKWIVCINGGRTLTSKDAASWAKEVFQRGAGEILLTSMDNDGTKNGFALNILKKISSSVNCPIIASGGAGTKYHFLDAFKIGLADAALAANVFHFNKISIPKLKTFLYKNKVPVRI